MRQFGWVDWAIIGLLGVIFLLIAASGAAVASWDPPQITLVPGTCEVVEFTNTESIPITLNVDNRDAPPELSQLMLVSPSEIPENRSKEVTITFACTPAYAAQLIKEGLAPRIYLVEINGLLVFLDLLDVSEKDENHWAKIENRIDKLEASLMEEIEDLIVHMDELELENWALEIESLHENVRLGFDGLLVWVKSELDRIEASIPENSHPVDVEWYVKLLDNREAKIRAAIGNDIANMQIEERMADAESETDQALYIGFAAIVVAIVAVAVSITRSRATTPSPKVPRKFLTSEVAPEDKVAMLANEIGAMRERGEDADAIREKEQELATLKSQLKPKKRRKK